MVECGVAPLLDTPHSLHRSRLMVDHFPVWADRIQYWHIDDMDCATADEAGPPLCESCVKFLVETLLAEQATPALFRRAA